MTEETREKIRIAALRRYANETPEEKKIRSERMIGKNKGRKHTKEAIEKIKIARSKQKQVFDEKARKNMSEAQKAYWKTLSKEERELKIKRFVEAPRKVTKNTSIELKVKKQLDNLGIKYEQQKYCYNKRMKKGFYIDFYLPDYKIMLECNGTYWHSLKERKNRDELLKDLVENQKNSKKFKDLKVIFLWDNEINSNENLVSEVLSEYI